MKIISFAARKGGVGKTTITYLMANYLTEIKKEKVLIIDADPQANLTSMYLENNQINKTADLFDKTKLDLSIGNTIGKTKIENLHIIPSTIKLDELDELNEILVAKTMKESIVYRLLKTNTQISKIKTYDYVFIDTNPSLSTVNKNMFFISDNICLISNPSIYAVDGVISIYRDWENICEMFGVDNNIRCIILNSIAKNKKRSKDLLDLIQKHQFLKDLTLTNYLPEYETIATALNAHKSLSDSKILKNLGDPIQKNYNELLKKEIL